MAATPSVMLPLGTCAPDFALPDVVTGRTVRLSDFAGEPLLVIFLCRHCPYVKHIETQLYELGRQYCEVDGELPIVAISSNDATAYPEDAPDKLAAWAKALQFPFPVLYDETQEVARAYHAACTPDFFLFDHDTDCHHPGHKLAYRGQLDDSRPGNGKPVTGRDLRAAIDALLAGEPISPDQTPSLGCNIKWKKG
jgi:peroxiredoxin